MRRLLYIALLVPFLLGTHCAKYNAQQGTLGFVNLAALTGSGFTDWHLLEWNTRYRLSFNNASRGSDLADFPVLVRLESTRFDYALAQASGQDLRFVDSDGTALSHEVEVWSAGGVSLIWVRVPRITGASNADYIWLYAGNASATDAQAASLVWPNHYSAVWHLNSGLNDSTANALNGTNNGSTAATGVLGGGRNFSSAGSQYFTVGTGLTTALSSSFTLTAWLRTTQTGNANPWQCPAITGRDLSGSTGDIFVGYINASGAIALRSGNALGANSGAINDGAWRLIGLQRDSPSGEVRAYVNGTLVDTRVSTAGAVTATLTDIGRLNGSTRFLDGDLDELRISTAQHNADWMSAQYASMSDSLLQYSVVEQRN